MDLEAMKKRDAELDSEIAALRQRLKDALLEQQELRQKPWDLKVGDIVSVPGAKGPVEAIIRDIGYVYHLTTHDNGKPSLKVSVRRKDGGWSETTKTVFSSWQKRATTPTGAQGG